MLASQPAIIRKFHCFINACRLPHKNRSDGDLGHILRIMDRGMYICLFCKAFAETNAQHFFEWVNPDHWHIYLALSAVLRSKSARHARGIDCDTAAHCYRLVYVPGNTSIWRIPVYANRCLASLSVIFKHFFGSQKLSLSGGNNSTNGDLRTLCPGPHLLSEQ